MPLYRMISKVGSASCQDVISCMVAEVGGPGQVGGSDHVHRHCRMRKEYGQSDRASAVSEAKF